MKSVSRRDFLKFSAVSLGGLVSLPWQPLTLLPEFPQAERLGRVTAGKIEVKARPDADSQTVGVLYEDAIILWLREVVGKSLYQVNQRWVETPEGYLYAPYIQPVQNFPNLPVQNLPETSLGPGMWAEVSVPYVDLIQDNPPPRSPLLKDRAEIGLPPRLYYSQIVWIDQIKFSEAGNALYRVNEKYGSYGDILWGAAQAFRPLTQEEFSPIRPEVEEKRVLVDVTYQTLSCYEGKNEVFFTRISSGAKWDAWGNPVDVWATPIGGFPIWRKLISLHMSGGTTGGGWDLPGVGWVSLFVGSGVAIHSTFWHNNYGVPMSRGCVNARPDDSKWIFRWTTPIVNYDPGDAMVSMPGGTKVEVVES